MLTARRYLAAVTIDGQIFVIGGVNDSGRLPTMERYDQRMSELYGTLRVKCAPPARHCAETPSQGAQLSMHVFSSN